MTRSPIRTILWGVALGLACEVSRYVLYVLSDFVYWLPAGPRYFAIDSIVNEGAVVGSSADEIEMMVASTWFVIVAIPIIVGILFGVSLGALRKEVRYAEALMMILTVVAWSVIAFGFSALQVWLGLAEFAFVLLGGETVGMKLRMALPGARSRRPR